VIQTSEEQRQFATGAVRDAADHKSRIDLIPPFALERIGQHYRAGAVHYGDRNWEKGMPQSTFLQSLKRHIVAYQQGETSEDHLSGAAFNLLALIDQEERIRLGLLDVCLDDLPHYLSRRTVRPLIYIAGPLTATEAKNVRRNRDVAKAWGDRCFQRGWSIYVPHTMTEHWFKRTEPEFNDYTSVVAGQDFGVLHRCQAILFCPDWESSKGSKMEHDEAERIGLAMYYHHSDVPDLRKEPENATS